MRSILVSWVFVVALTGCSRESESISKTDTVTIAREESATATSLSDFELWVYADKHPPYAFALLGTGRSTGKPLLLILEETETPAGLKQRADYAIPLSDLKGRLLSHPLALLAVRDRYDEGLQRVFTVWESTSDSAVAHALTEVLVNLESLDSSEVPVTMGRVFNLPVRGSLTGASLNALPKGSRLTVNVPAPNGDPAQPVTLVYDINSNARMLDPIDTLMVPMK